MIAMRARVFHLENDLESCQQMTLSLLERQPINISVRTEIHYITKRTRKHAHLDYQEKEMKKVLIEESGKIVRYIEELKNATP